MGSINKLKKKKKKEKHCDFRRKLNFIFIQHKNYVDWDSPKICTI